jgi:tetratricopeptide (TPR) repeat protein
VSELSPWRARYAALVERLEAPDAAAERDALKADIIALYKALEAHLTDAARLRDDVKALVGRWKALDGGASDTAPDGARPPVWADHLGASTYVEKGWTRLSQDDATGAEAALRQALAKSPGDPTAEALLGWALLRQARHPEAAELLTALRRRDPAHALTRTVLGCLHLQQGAWAEARAELDEAIRLGSDRKATLYAHLYLGRWQLEQQRYAEAEASCQAALALGPNLVEAQYLLGWARWLGGATAAARASWQAGAAAVGAGRWGRDCAEALAAVEAGREPVRAQ